MTNVIYASIFKSVPNCTDWDEDTIRKEFINSITSIKTLPRKAKGGFPTPAENVSSNQRNLAVVAFKSLDYTDIYDHEVYGWQTAVSGELH